MTLECLPNLMRTTKELLGKAEAWDPYILSLSNLKIPSMLPYKNLPRHHGEILAAISHHNVPQADQESLAQRYNSS